MLRLKQDFFFLFCLDLSPETFCPVVSQDSVKSHSEVGKACVSLQILCRSQTDISIEVASLSWLCRRLFVGQMLSSPIIAGNRFFKKQRKKNAGNRFCCFIFALASPSSGKSCSIFCRLQTLEVSQPIGWLAVGTVWRNHQSEVREGSFSLPPVKHHPHHLNQPHPPPSPPPLLSLQLYTMTFK